MPEYGCTLLASTDLLCVVVCVEMYVCVSECVLRVRMGWCANYKHVDVYVRVSVYEGALQVASSTCTSAIVCTCVVTCILTCTRVCMYVCECTCSCVSM